MSRPDASVVIVSYNTRDLTLRCLRELLASRTPDVTFDVTVVDNASIDGSADAIAADLPDVRLIRLAENVGWGRAVNRGALGTDGAYLLLLNPDTTPVGHPVADLVRFALQHPEQRLYTGRTLRPDGSDDGYSCWGRPTLWSHFTFATGLSTALPRQAWANPEGLPGYDRRSVREVPAVSGCCMLVERDLFYRLGGFDPAFFLYSEDIDLCPFARRSPRRCARRRGHPCRGRLVQFRWAASEVAARARYLCAPPLAAVTRPAGLEPHDRWRRPEGSGQVRTGQRTLAWRRLDSGVARAARLAGRVARGGRATTTQNPLTAATPNADSMIAG